MEKDPARRYATAAAFADDIVRRLRGEPILARPSGFLQRFGKRVRRDPWRWGLGAAAATAFLVFVPLMAAQQARHDRRLRAAQKAGEAGTAFLTGDLAETERLANEAVSIAPDHVLARYWLGRLKLRAYQLQRPLPAVWRTDWGVEISPAEPPTPGASRALQEARDHFNAMAATSPEGAHGEEADAAAGILALYAGDYAAAAERLRAALDARPVDWELQYLLGVARYFDGRFDESARELDPLLDRDLPGAAAVLDAYLKTQAAAILIAGHSGGDPSPLYEAAVARAAPLAGHERVSAALAAVESAYAVHLMMHGRPEAEATILRAVERAAGGEALLLLGDWNLAHGRGEEAERAYREAIEAYAGAGLGGARARLRLVEFLRQRGRDDEAINLCREARAGLPPDSVEARILETRFSYMLLEITPGEAAARLEGEIARRPDHLGLRLMSAEFLLMAAHRRQDVGKAADEDFRRAMEAAERAIAVNPRSPWPWFYRGRARLSWAGLTAERGDDADAPFRAAIEEDLAEALRLNPDRAEFHESCALIRIAWGGYRDRIGGDPGPLYRDALEDTARASAIDPESTKALVILAETHLVLGNRAAERGVDPTPHYRRAIEEGYDAALRVNPEDESALCGRGSARANLANYLGIHGEDPAPLLRQAIEEDFKVALRIDPQDWETWARMGGARVDLGASIRRSGGDPTEHYRTAIEEDYARALQINPGAVEALLRRGDARLNWAIYRDLTGEDPFALLRAAIDEDYSRAIEINPMAAECFIGRGHARVARADALDARGSDPEDDYRAAVETDFARALEIDPDNAEIWSRRGEARLNWGVAVRARGGDPAELYRAAADTDFAAAIRLDPDDVRSHVGRGLARTNLGNLVWARDGDPSGHYRRAIEEDFAAALEIDGRSVEALLWRGTARVNRALSRSERGEDPVPALRAAVEEDFTRALEVNPGLGTLWVRRGDARAAWAAYVEDPAPLLRAAIEDDYAGALRVNPDDVDAFFGRGKAYLKWGRPREALAEFEKALERAPELAERPDWRERIEEARAAAEEY